MADAYKSDGRAIIRNLTGHSRDSSENNYYYRHRRSVTSVSIEIGTHTRTMADLIGPGVLPLHRCGAAPARGCCGVHGTGAFRLLRRNRRPVSIGSYFYFNCRGGRSEIRRDDEKPRTKINKYFIYVTARDQGYRGAKTFRPYRFPTHHLALAATIALNDVRFYTMSHPRFSKRRRLIFFFHFRTNK